MKYALLLDIVIIPIINTIIIAIKYFMKLFQIDKEVIESNLATPAEATSNSKKRKLNHSTSAKGSEYGRLHIVHILDRQKIIHVHS